MKIEEPNPHVSTCSVAMEEIYTQYEARGIFGKRNISLVFMYSPHKILRTIWFGMHKTLRLVEARLGLEILT